MRLAGIILTILGVILVSLAFMTDTTVTGVAAAAAPAETEAGVVAVQRETSLALLQRQMMILHVGLANLIAGIGLFVGGEIADRVTRVRGGESAPAAAASAAAPASGSSVRWQARGVTRRDAMIGGALVAAILMILLAFGLFGRGSEPTADGTMVVNALDPYDAELIEEDQTLAEAENRARAAAAARKEREEAERNAAATPAPAPDPADAPEPVTNSAQPQDPIANVTVNGL